MVCAMKTKRTFLPALRKAVKELGSQHKAAKAIGVPQTTISYWLSRADKIPWDAPGKFERATGGKIAASEFFG